MQTMNEVAGEVEVKARQDLGKTYPKSTEPCGPTRRCVCPTKGHSRRSREAPKVTLQGREANVIDLTEQLEELQTKPEKDDTQRHISFVHQSIPFISNTTLPPGREDRTTLPLDPAKG